MQNRSLKDKLPGYFLGKEQLTLTLPFTALFAVVFIMLAVPFSPNCWFRLGSAQGFGCTAVFLMLSLAILYASKRLMYFKLSGKEVTVLQYFLWLIAELVAIALVYATMTAEGTRMGIIDIPDPSFSRAFFRALMYGAPALWIPYIIAAQYFALQDRDNTIRLMNYSNVVSDERPTPLEQKRITLFDNNGVLKFSVSSDNLFFFESDDNYIQVWYLDSASVLRKYMLRCRLKTIEDSFADSNLIRCHRKYIVNMDKVKLLMPSKDGYCVVLDSEAIEPIPISKTYEQAVLARFNSR